MKIQVQPGEKLIIGLADENGNVTDGEFTFEYEPAEDRKEGAIRISAELPDTDGREGVIYEERFGGLGGDDDEKAVVAKKARS